MQAQFQRVERAVKGYWFNDGIAEMIGGAVFILIGIYFSLGEMLGSSSLLGSLFQMAFLLVFLGLIYGGRVLIKLMKEKYTLPRSGYLEYRVDKTHVNQRRIAAGLLAAIMALVLIVFLPLGGRVNWVVALSGLIIGSVFFLGQARTTGIQRFSFLGLISVGFGIGFAVSHLPDGFALGFFYSASGLIFLISGLLVFLRFLKENPVRLNPEK
jgi:hypothetical protein